MRSDHLFRDRFALDTSLLFLKTQDDESKDFENVLTRVFAPPSWQVSQTPVLQRMHWLLYDERVPVSLVRPCKLEIMDARWNRQTVWPNDEPWLLTETFAQQAEPHLRTAIRIEPGTYTLATWAAAIEKALQVGHGLYNVQMIDDHMIIRSDMSQPVFELAVPPSWTARTGALARDAGGYRSVTRVDLTGASINIEYRGNLRPRENPVVTLLVCDEFSPVGWGRSPIPSAMWTFDESDRPVEWSLRLSVNDYVVTSQILVRVWTY